MKSRSIGDGEPGAPGAGDAALAIAGAVEPKPCEALGAEAGFAAGAAAGAAAAALGDLGGAALLSAGRGVCTAARLSPGGRGIAGAGGLSPPPAEAGLIGVGPRGVVGKLAGEAVVTPAGAGPIVRAAAAFVAADSFDAGSSEGVLCLAPLPAAAAITAAAAVSAAADS